MSENEQVNGLIMATINDLVADFLYYDRREDEQLPPGTIEQAVTDGTVTVDAMTAAFKDALVNGLQQ